MAIKLNQYTRITLDLLNIFVREDKDIKLSINGNISYKIVPSPLFEANTDKAYRYIMLFKNDISLGGSKLQDKNLNIEKWLDRKLAKLNISYQNSDIWII